jgi:hypothetical protein
MSWATSGRHRGARRSGTWLAARAVIAVVLVCTWSRAQPDSSEERSSVDITLIGLIGQDRTFPGRVTSWFDPRRFAVGVQQAAVLEPSRVLAPDAGSDIHVWVILSRDDLARLYFAIRASESGEATYLVRDLRLESGLDELGKERIAEVLHLSVLALLDGAEQSPRPDVERALRDDTEARSGSSDGAKQTAETAGAALPTSEPTRPKPALGARVERSSSIRVGARLGYGVNYRGDEGLWHGPRGTLLVHGERIGVGLALQGVLPSTSSLSTVELEVYGASLLLAADFRVPLGGDWAFEAFAGPGLDVIHYSSSALSPEVAAGRSDTEARPNLGLGARIAWKRILGVAAALQLSVPLDDTHYDVVVSGEREVVADALPVTPLFGLEVCF